MSPTRLLQYFEQISEAPDPMPRLRQFILDLAVRGKLVEQDPGDEPASELLKRIEADKNRLAKDGVINTPKAMTSFDQTEGLFDLPGSWQWIRLAEVGSVVGGGTPPSKDSACFTEGGKGVAWLTPADLGRQKCLLVSHGERDLTEKGVASSSAQLMPAGSVLFTSRAPIGYTAIAANEISTNQGFKSVVPFVMESNRYIAVYFRAFATWIDGKASGTTFKEVSGKIVANLPFPLPTLAEQHRIVAKVDELMALCDELEAAQAKRERRRDRLVAATLHGLNNGDENAEPGTRATFEGSARFYCNHLPRLTTRPEHIRQLRQTILNLALRGKLIPQDPNDEPIAVLLKRVAQEKERRIEEGNGNRRHWVPPKIDASTLPSLPGSWGWVRVQDVVCVVTVGHVGPTANRYKNNGIPFLRSQNVRPNRFEPIGLAFIDEVFHAELRKSELSGGDVVIVRSGNVGVSCVVPDWLGRANCADLVIVKGPIGIDSRFLCYYLNSITDSRIQAGKVGIALSHFNTKSVAFLAVPLPPLAEQQRIVAKVDELLALCDELESRLTTTATTRRQLREAVLHEALEGDS